MHPYLIRNIGPPLFDVSSSQGAFVCIPKLSLFFRCIDLFMCKPSLNCNAVPILGCLRLLLLSLLIKHECSPKCGIAWFIMKSLTDHSSSVLSWELFSHWLCASCQHPSRLSISHKLASSWNNTLQVYVITSLPRNYLVVQTCIS